MLRRSISWFVSFTPIYMPSLSPSMESGKIVEWKKKVGDKIDEGEVWCTVETDKATVDYTNVMETGYLAAVYVGDGERVNVGTTIAVIVEDAEDIGKGKEYVVKDAAAADTPTPASTPAPTEAPTPTATSSSSSTTTTTKAPRRYGNSLEEAIAASGPSIARLTKGVDKATLSTFVPSGKGGRFTKGDFSHLPTFAYHAEQEGTAAAATPTTNAAKKPSTKATATTSSAEQQPVIKRMAVKDFTVTDTKLIRTLAAKIQKQSQRAAAATSLTGNSSKGEVRQALS